MKLQRAFFFKVVHHWPHSSHTCRHQALQLPVSSLFLLCGLAFPGSPHIETQCPIPLISFSIPQVKTLPRGLSELPPDHRTVPSPFQIACPQLLATWSLNTATKLIQWAKPHTTAYPYSGFNNGSERTRHGSTHLFAQH